MRFERLDRAPASSPAAYTISPVQIALPVCAALALLATLGLWTLAWAPAGLQHLLLLCLARLAVLVCVSAASFRALARRRGDSASPGSAASLHPHSRASLTQAALCLQLAWLATELLLGSGLLLFYPYLLGPTADQGGITAPLLSVLPLVCAAAMSGCFMFLKRLTSRRRRACSGRACASPRCPSLECGLGLGRGRSSDAEVHMPAPAAYGASLSGSSCCLPLATSASSSSLDGMASPLSESGSFSSASSAAYFPTSYGSGSSSLLGGCGGAPSPTGHVHSSECSAAHHEAALQAACEVLLVEHQLDTLEYCLFVHKRLRPIRTRPEDKHRPAPQGEKPGLLRELITNSFTFKHDPELRAQLAATMAATSAGSSASSVTFQQAAAAATGVQVM